MDRSCIGIVIPAFNESATIESVVKEASVYGMPIVVDDGSIDNTSKLALNAGAFVVSYKNNQGYDYALDRGFYKAAQLDVEIIITLDADGQHSPLLIKKFIEKIIGGADVVVGERNERQRFSEHLFAWYASFRYGIKDPLCGMKAYRKKVYESLGHFDSYGSIGTELMLFAAKNEFVIEQVLIKVRERDGKSRFGHVVTGNYRILRAMIFSFWRIKKYIL